jgi:hypothetical protein
MVQAIPWLDWQQHTKNAEAHVLAEWLWWLAVTAPQQGVVGALVATHQPAPTRFAYAGAQPTYPMGPYMNWY